MQALSGIVYGIVRTVIFQTSDTFTTSRLIFSGKQFFAELFQGLKTWEMVKPSDLNHKNQWFWSLGIVRYPCRSSNKIEMDGYRSITKESPQNSLVGCLVTSYHVSDESSDENTAGNSFKSGYNQHARYDQHDPDTPGHEHS